MQTNDEIVAQLTEMFGDTINQEQIFDACKMTNFNLDNAIDYLLTAPTPTIVSSSTSIVPTNTPTKNLGAIKKTNFPASSISFASLLNSNNDGFKKDISSPKKKGKNNNHFPRNFDEVIEQITKGYRIMVIMRGCPGSGKSYLAKQILNKSYSSNPNYKQQHIFSADDFFTINGNYMYDISKLDDAHKYAQNKTMTKAREGYSPIVIDNTNMQLWEMEPYVKIGVENGYQIHIMEPNTPWRNNPSTLAKKNKHFVPEYKLVNILEKYQTCTVAELLKKLNLEHHLLAEPKIRHYPIYKTDLRIINENNQEEDRDDFMFQSLSRDYDGERNDSNVFPVPKSKDDGQWYHDWGKELCGEKSTKILDQPELKTISLPKPPRLDGTNSLNPFWSSGAAPMPDLTQVEPKDDWSLDFKNTDWTPFEDERQGFWNANNNNSSRTSSTEPKAKRKNGLSAPSTITSIQVPNEWKADAIKAEETKKDDEYMEWTVTSKLEKHKSGCANENKSFLEICLLYPSIPADYLWDLFEKCKADADWTVSLLLEEMKTENFETLTLPKIAFHCKCEESDVLPNVFDEVETPFLPAPIEPTMAFPKPSRKEKLVNDELLAAKRQIEQNFVLGNEHFSDHINKIREFRGIISPNQSDGNGSTENVAAIDDDEDDRLSSDSSDLIEITLGKELVSQLHGMFHPKSSESKIDVANVKSNVFMNKQMARDLYHLWLETMYNYNEEERQKAIKLDREYASTLFEKEKYQNAIPVYSDEKTDEDETPNLKDIIEMEEALSAYRNKEKEWKKTTPQDLASILTRQKLCELFPDINKEVLCEILEAHNNKFEDTVNVLNNTIKDMLVEKTTDLFKKAQIEAVKIVENSTKLKPASKPAPDESITSALENIEEYRNLASHHNELKSLCQEKARNATTRNLRGVAYYYSEIARLHSSKVDLYNHKASNYISEVHQLTQNNDEVLDLHHLHAEEAVQSLDRFVSRHAISLKERIGMQYKDIYVITGRGLHSVAGIPIIKFRVKTSLKAKGLRFTEINPGFLRIRIFNNQNIDRLIS